MPMVVMDRNHATDPTTEALPDHVSPNIFPLDRVVFLINAKAVCISCDMGQVGQGSPEDDDSGFHVESDVLACCKLERSLACVFDMQIYQILLFVESIIKVTTARTSEYFRLYAAAGDDYNGTATSKSLWTHTAETLMQDQIGHVSPNLDLQIVLRSFANPLLRYFFGRDRRWLFSYGRHCLSAQD